MHVLICDIFSKIYISHSCVCGFVKNWRNLTDIDVFDSLTERDE